MRILRAYRAAIVVFIGSTIFASWRGTFDLAFYFLGCAVMGFVLIIFAQRVEHREMMRSERRERQKKPTKSK